jgi:hypothetical protein
MGYLKAILKFRLPTDKLTGEVEIRIANSAIFKADMQQNEVRSSGQIEFSMCLFN